MSARPLITPAKRALLTAVHAAGGFALFRAANAGRGLVLMYHRFGEKPGDDVVSRQQFEAHLRYLTARYTVVPLRELAAWVAERRPLARPPAAITIDDGHADAYEIAFPALKRFGAPATLFVVTGFIDGACWVWTDLVFHMFACTRRPRVTVALGSSRLDLDVDSPRARLAAAVLVTERLKQFAEPDKNAALGALARSLDVEAPAAPTPDYAPVTWAQIRELERHGVTAEAHTVTHPILTNVSSEQLMHELTESKARLERELGRPSQAFCYPNGDCSATVRDAVQLAGFTCAVLSSGGLNAPGDDTFGLKRIGAEAELPRFVKATSGFETWQMNLRRPRAARMS